jgi:hypothetical protein
MMNIGLWCKEFGFQKDKNRQRDLSPLRISSTRPMTSTAQQGKGKARHQGQKRRLGSNDKEQLEGLGNNVDLNLIHHFSLLREHVFQGLWG